MVFAADGRKRGHRFLRGLMRSAAKLAYEQAQAAIDGNPDDTTGPLLEPVLQPLWAAYGAMKAARERRAPLPGRLHGPVSGPEGLQNGLEQRPGGVVGI